MGNLQRQIAAIRGQLAHETAATIARMEKVRVELSGRIVELSEHMNHGFQELKQTIHDQSMVQQAAMDQLLSLVAEDQEELRVRVTIVEERLARLEQDRPPAA